MDDINWIDGDVIKAITEQEYRSYHCSKCNRELLEGWLHADVELECLACGHVTEVNSPSEAGTEQ